MRIPQSYIQKCKIVAHVAQVIFIFVAICVAIAMFTREGTSGGASKFYIALCFLSLPAIVYLTMVPMWSRAERFANAYAFIAVDALYTLLWFAAIIAVALWNSRGVRQGAEERKIEGAKNCTTFAYGSEAKCSLSRTTVGLGVVIAMLFAITTAVSGYYLSKFLKEGVLPYEAKAPNPHHVSGDTSKDNAWSTEIENPRHSVDSDRHTEHGGNQQEDEYALLHSTETEEGRHPGRPLSWGEDRVGYNRPAPPYADYRDGVHGADALSPGGYEEYRREAGSSHGQAPPSGPGYSFSGGPR